MFEEEKKTLHAQTQKVKTRHQQALTKTEVEDRDGGKGTETEKEQAGRSISTQSHRLTCPVWPAAAL